MAQHVRHTLTEKRRRFSAERSIGQYLASHAVRKLQIGAGTNHLPGWLNTDIEPDKDEVYLDASGPYPIPSESIDYIFAEQLIEHLGFEQGLEMLKEWRRILRGHGTIRIATPNLLTLVGLFRDESAEAKRYAQQDIAFNNLSLLPTAPSAVLNMQMHRFGHQFLYDPETLSRALTSVGFRSIRTTPVGRSDDPALDGIDSHGKVVGEELNRYVTMVYEASK